MLSARDVARAIRRSIEVARERLRSGDALMLFAEGTRSRTGSMQPMLAGVARYLDVSGTWVLPVGLVGSEALFPVDSPTLRPARVVMQLGRPIQAEVLLTRAGGERLAAAADRQTARRRGERPRPSGRSSQMGSRGMTARVRPSYHLAEPDSAPEWGELL